MPQERQGHEGGLAAEELVARARGALAAIESARARIDDLNVFPVPDGDTGTNLTLTVRAVVDALERSPAAAGREALARTASDAALRGARGNSGVLLSQIVRGAAESFAAGEEVARMLRRASDTVRAAVREPVEGTMLTLVADLAAEAEAGGSLEAIVAAGERSLARTRDLLPVLREAGVVDAGAAGLFELVRGFAGLGPDHLPLTVSLRSVHRELSAHRFCTSFVVEGERLDAGELERALAPLGDSLLVVGDERALRVHVHTNDADAAIALGRARGAVDAIEVADMHEQIAAREERLVHARCAVVAVAAGGGNRRLLESLGAVAADGASAVAAAVAAARTAEVVVVAAGIEVGRAGGARVLQAGSVPAALSAMVAFDPYRSAEENLEAMGEAAGAVAVGAVRARGGPAAGFAGLVGGETVVEAASLREAALPVVERLLAEPRGVLTLLAGERASGVEELATELAAAHPEVELELHAGGQPDDELLLGAE